MIALLVIAVLLIGLSVTLSRPAELAQETPR
jgi:hypothetical protein